MATSYNLDWQKAPYQTPTSKFRHTLLGIITVGLLTTGKNKKREKYGEIPQNPPLYPGHNNPE
jgi:hypothetical protein